MGDVTQIEGDTGSSSVELTVTLTGSTELPATVSYATDDGTATAGEDYAPVGGLLTFAPGETAHTVTVEVNGDLVFEPDETFSLDSVRCDQTPRSAMTPRPGRSRTTTLSR